ncbi:S-type pyocin domain-containing protein [Erwinia tasmaniensis]|uniref:S-type pyocin domain-containing protein n=1 Tax=Erwinia tasmaniensis TaxID=338565 RepID=UPI003A4D3B87
MQTLLNESLPRIRSDSYTLPLFTAEENQLLRENSYARQLVQVKIFDISHIRASAAALLAETDLLRAKGDTAGADQLQQQAAALNGSVAAYEAELVALRESAAEINTRYEAMYQAASQRFSQHRAEENRKAVEAYRQQRKQDLQDYLSTAMVAANIKSAEQLSEEIEKTRQSLQQSIPSIDAAWQEIAESIAATLPVTEPISPPDIKIDIPAFGVPAPPSFMPQKTLEEQQAWAQTKLAVAGTVVLRGFAAEAESSRSPLSFAGHQLGSVTFAGEEADRLWQRAEEARKTLQETSHTLPAAVTLTAIDFTDTDISTVMLPADVLGLTDSAALNRVGDTIALSLTAQLVLQDNLLKVALVRHEKPVNVPVVHLSAWSDADTGFYHYDLCDDAGVRVPVLITPDKAPGSGPLTPQVPQIPEAIIHTGNNSGTQPAPVVETLPAAGDTGYRERIIIPPAASGLKPLWIMFNYLPGKLSIMRSVTH